MTKVCDVYLPDVVGRGYGTFWHYRGRYRVVKGSRGSKKSKTTALWYIYNMMQYPGSNLLVVRKTFRSLQDSCYTELLWAADRLGVGQKWHFTLSPIQAVYKPTGQKIIFRGLDDPLKISSITVKTGALCWLWIEEAYEIMNEGDFKTLDESIRGEVPPNLWKQVTLTFNPWNERHWLKARFFDHENPNILALTTTYKCNEFLDEADRNFYDEMRTRDPKRYRVSGLGEWGVVEGLIFENWHEERFDPDDLAKKGLERLIGLDFGYTNDPTAVVFLYADPEERKLYIYDEIYKTGMTNEQIAKELLAHGFQWQTITADSAEPKSIDRLKTLGLRRIRGARKGRDSVNAGIDYLLEYEFIVHPQCVNFLTEVSSYSWGEDKYGKRLNVPEDANNHLMDALRYATEHLQRPKVYSFD